MEPFDENEIYVMNGAKLNREIQPLFEEIALLKQQLATAKEEGAREIIPIVWEFCRTSVPSTCLPEWGGSRPLIYTPKNVTAVCIKLWKESQK